METIFLSSKITYMNQDDCSIYKKHHNTIDGIFQTGGADRWDEINLISDIDWEIDKYYDGDGIGITAEINDFGDMIRDLPVYTLFEITDKYPNWDHVLPGVINNLDVTIFILIVNDRVYLCETQGCNYLRYIVDVTGIPPIKTLESRLIMSMI